MNCVVCKTKPVKLPGYSVTCSEACHEALVTDLEKRFGVHKKVVDVRTGRAYKVPTRHIVERGLIVSDLPTFPLWEGD